jgi:uracil-DNA glycosylase
LAHQALAQNGLRAVSRDLTWHRFLSARTPRTGICRLSCNENNRIKADGGRNDRNNSVHFRRRVRSIHQKPSAREIEACRPWLEAEIRVIDPRVLVCMVATAVQSIFRRHLPILQNRGRWMSSSVCPKTLITVHPSSILKAIRSSTA